MVIFDHSPIADVIFFQIWLELDIDQHCGQVSSFCSTFCSTILVQLAPWLLHVIFLPQIDMKATAAITTRHIYHCYYWWLSLEHTTPSPPLPPRWLPFEQGFPPGVSATPLSFVSSAQLPRVHSVPSFRSLMKIFNRTAPSIDPLGTSLVTGLQTDFMPLISTFTHW